MAWMGFSAAQVPSGLGAALMGLNQGMEQGTQLYQRQQQLNLQRQQYENQEDLAHLGLLFTAARTDPDLAKTTAEALEALRSSKGRPTGFLATYAAKLSPDDAELLPSLPAVRALLNNPKQAMESPSVSVIADLNQQITDARRQREATQSSSKPSSVSGPSYQPSLGVDQEMGLGPVLTPSTSVAPSAPQATTNQSTQNPIAKALDSINAEIAKYTAALNETGLWASGSTFREDRTKRLMQAWQDAIKTLQQQKMDVLKLMQPVVATPGSVIAIPGTRESFDPFAARRAQGEVTALQPNEVRHIPGYGHVTLSPPDPKTGIPELLRQPYTQDERDQYNLIRTRGWNPDTESSWANAREEIRDAKVNDWLSAHKRENTPQNRDKAREEIAKREIVTRVELTQPKLSQDAVEMAADYVNQKGTLPPGLGFSNPRMRQQILDRAAQKAKEIGIGEGGWAAREANFKANQAELTRIQTQRGPVLAFARTTERNLDIATDLSNRVDRTQIPVVNRWLVSGQQQWLGDPKTAAFAAATRTAINEYARVTTTTTGGGVTSDQARKEVEAMLSTAQTPEQFREVVNTLRLEMRNRIKGYEDQIRETQGRIKTLRGEPDSESTGNVPSLPKVPSGYKIEIVK